MVVGTSGDILRLQWVVAAYTNREQAELHLAILRKLLRSYIAGVNRSRSWRTEYDPYLTDLTAGSHELAYGIKDVPLVCHVDEFLEHHSTL